MVNHVNHFDQLLFSSSLSLLAASEVEGTFNAGPSLGAPMSISPSGYYPPSSTSNSKSPLSFYFFFILEANYSFFSLIYSLVF